MHYCTVVMQLEPHTYYNYVTSGKVTTCNTYSILKMYKMLYVTYEKATTCYMSHLEKAKYSVVQNSAWYT